MSYVTLLIVDKPCGIVGGSNTKLVVEYLGISLVFQHANYLGTVKEN
jgi:hypothetical protein